VIAADAQATTYQASEPGKFASDLGAYGCVYGQTRLDHLGEVPECGIGAKVCGGVRRELLAGTVVAYESFFSGIEEDRWYVAVRDLRSGHLLHHVPTGTPLNRNPAFAGVGPVVDLVVKSDGNVSWIAEDAERSSHEISTSREVPYFDVYVADKSGTRLLASGFDVSRSSLAIADSTLYWTQGGKPNGLSGPSVVSCEDITTVPTTTLGAQIGVLLDDQEPALSEAIAAAFDLD